jgi:hypothetical protein
MGRILLIAAGVTLVVMLVLVAAVRLLAPDGEDAAPQPQATVAAMVTPAVVVTAAASSTPETGASDAGAATETATPKPTLTPASSSTWRVAGALSGSGTLQGRVFRLRGDEQKLVWNLAGSNPVALIDVMRGDIVWWKDRGGREASPAGAGRGSALLHLKRGEYYLYVFSTSGTWEVAVWDRR